MPESWNTVNVPTAYKVGQLRLNATNLSRTYGVSLTIGTGGLSQTFNYEISLKYAQLGGQQYLVEINKGRVYINDKSAEQMIDQFSEKCGSVLYPLKVQTDIKGRFIRITNHLELKDRWRKMKDELSAYYQGEVFVQLLNSMDLAINNELYLNKTISADWFFSLYFSPVYLINTESVHPEGELDLPVLPYTNPLKFNIKQSIDTTPTESKTFEIRQQGVYSDSRSAEDLLKGRTASLSDELEGIHTPAQGTAELKYKFYLSDHSISAVTGNINLLMGTTEKSVGIQIYHLREKDRLQTGASNTQIIEEVKPEKKKGFFSFLFS